MKRSRKSQKQELERQINLEDYEAVDDKLQAVVKRAAPGEMFTRLMDQDGKEFYRTEV